MTRDIRSYKPGIYTEFSTDWYKKDQDHKTMFRIVHSVYLAKYLLRTLEADAAKRQAVE